MSLPKPLRQSIPTRADYSNLKAKSSASNNTLNSHHFATTALSPAWDDAVEWGERNGVLSDLLHLIHTTIAWYDPVISVGTSLSFIASDYARQVLCEWSSSERAALLLNELSTAVKQDPRVILLYPPFPAEKPAAQQFRGNLDTHYLIALITEGLPPGDATDKVWFHTLKLWVFTHAICREFFRNVQDTSIREVATKLRMACSHAADWRSVFLQLKTGITDFDLLSRTLIQKSAGLLSARQTPPLSLPQRQLLHAIMKVARREHAHEDQHALPVWPVMLPLDQYQTSNTAPYQPLAAQLYEEEGEENSQWISVGEDTTDGLLQIEINSEQSFAHQKLKGNSLLLYSTEELQYLPWSWKKLNPIEQALVEEWIKQASTDPEHERCHLSAVLWLALRLGRSLKRTLEIRISDSINEEWAFDPAKLTLSRLPPRREPGWQPKTTEQANWVTPPAEIQTISLPAKIGIHLRSRHEKCPDADCIGDLWDPVWGDSLENLFKQQFSKTVPRITGGMLACALPQEIFHRSQDQTLARLQASHPQSALPGACAYASWSTNQISSLINIDTLDCPNTLSVVDDNALGSLLDPIESLLANAIHSAVIKLEILSTGNDLVAFHNAYVAYIAASLLAATGARPIRDPFESFLHFDLEEQFVYVRDKVSSELRQGRIVPLPKKLCKFIREDYTAHLTLLAQHIHDINPALSDNINRLTSISATASIPFLFLLSKNAQTWKSLSESEIVDLKLFDWPLPLNHFRHRLSKQLRKREVDPEVIDSILGHAETGAATHGDYSFRIWDQDVRHARTALESAFDHLGFLPISNWRGKETGFANVAQDSKGVLGPEDFGMAARDKQRRKRYIASVRDARLQISQFLNNRALSDLTEAEVDLLSRQLLFREDGMPLPNGYQKYRVLLKRIEREWNQQGRKAKLSRRYQPISEERSPFSTNAPGAVTTFKQIEAQLSDILATGINKISFREAAVISATLLCIENRISSTRILADILHSRHFRLVSLKGIPYFEYDEHLKSAEDNVPTKRFRITDRAASYLDKLLGARNAKGEILPIPEILVPVTMSMEQSGRLSQGANANQMLVSLAAIVDQVNAIKLPGILCGYLAGRVPSFSLQWQDWVRRELGYAIQLDTEIDSATNDGDASENVIPINAEVATTLPVDISIPDLQQNARAFLKGAGELLSTTHQSSAVSRKDLARKLQSRIETFDGKVSSAVQLLGRWIKSILFRKGKDGLIRTSSITRYFVALSPIFEGVGYAEDILSMDDEEITTFYSNLMESSTAKDTKYVVERLLDFHRWARQEYAIAEPDWQELPETTSGAHVSPGLITEADYQHALQLLGGIRCDDVRSLLAAPFLLMLCFRFGLRSGEAFHLLRSDLLISDSMIVVYVQNNRHHILKTPTSRRQIPLLFTLSELEKSLLQSWLAETESVHGDDYSTPIFAKDGSAKILMDISTISKKILSALKTVTGNNSINIHHARHSAGNYVGIAVNQIHLQGWRNASPLCSPPESSKAELLLLGHAGHTRRKMWAISRYLGHVRRQTTCANYLHFLGDLADQHIGIAKHNVGKLKLKNATVLDDSPRLPSIDTHLIANLELKYADATLSRLLKLMRLVARGRSIQAAGDSLSIDERIAEKLFSILHQVGEKVAWSKNKLSERQGEAPAKLRLIQRVKENAWNRLISFALSVENKQPFEPDDESPSFDPVEMVGASRQILVWERKHFSVLRSFIDHTTIGQGEYILVTSTQCTDELTSLIEQCGFISTPLKEMKQRVRFFQMDTADAYGGKYSVQSRCALHFLQNDSKPIRNGLELLVLFIAYALQSSNATQR